MVFQTIRFLALVMAMGTQPGAQIGSATQDADALLARALEASQKGEHTQALDLATKAVEIAPKLAAARQLRAQFLEARGQYVKAIADYDKLVELEPGNPNSWQRRGEANFKAGNIAASIGDFDKFLNLVPSRKPYHWQRGISLYYAGRFAEGKQQFELHQTVNPHDVENAVWHFLCTARAEGIKSARRDLIPIEQDFRAPMEQVHKLFAGEATPDDVLKAARAARPEAGAGGPIFYANLYLGLYYEATGDKKRAREFILKAAEDASRNGYMGDVARVHADILRKGKPH